jgi:acetyltransferase EpsM
MTLHPKKVIIIGGIGNGSVIAAAMGDAQRRGIGEWEFAGYLNDRIEVGEQIEGHPVLGGLAQIGDFIKRSYHFIYTIYRIDGQVQRLVLFDHLNIPDQQLATFIHPLTYVAPNAKIGPGCVIMPNASISSGAELGRGCLVMVNASVGHNSTLSDFCHIAAQGCVSSYVMLKSGVHIGLNATVREHLTLGENSTLAMGAVLLNDVGPDEIWAGVPAKFLRKTKEEII